jgi:hypothetical protein
LIDRVVKIDAQIAGKVVHPIFDRRPDLAAELVENFGVEVSV